jgi:hypothetical protein
MAGLQRVGISLSAVQRSTRMPAAHLLAVLDGRRELSDAQIERIERLSGRTGGQLAAGACEVNGGPLTDLANVLATARSANLAHRKGRRKPKARTATAAAR